MALFTENFRCTQVQFFTDADGKPRYIVTLAQDEPVDYMIGPTYLTVSVADPREFLVGQYYAVKVGND